MGLLYPFKFKDVFKEKVWGGQKIRTILHKDFHPLPDCGEVWVLSALEGNASVVINGPMAGNSLDELLEVLMDDLVGESVYHAYGDIFPLLCKFIDANDFLSVQVHPDDALSQARHASLGKAEMWYVVQADPGAQLINGFSADMNPDSFLHALKNGNIKEHLAFVDVFEGDVFDIPPGRVHALGPGVLLAEIQQAADITYRVYDWDRPDKDGKMRDLHLDLAMDAIDYAKTKQLKVAYQSSLNKTVRLTQNQHFLTSLIHLDRPVEKDLSEMDAFVIYLCAAGRADIHYPGGKESLKMGELILVPAIMPELTIIPHGPAKILEVSC